MSNKLKRESKKAQKQKEVTAQAEAINMGAEAINMGAVRDSLCLPDEQVVMSGAEFNVMYRGVLEALEGGTLTSNYMNGEKMEVVHSLPAYMNTLNTAMNILFHIQSINYQKGITVGEREYAEINAKMKSQRDNQSQDQDPVEDSPEAVEEKTKVIELSK